MMHRAVDEAEDCVRASDADEAYACTFRNELVFFGITTVCISRRGDQLHLTVDSWSREKPEHRSLTPSEWDRLKTTLRRADFWWLPADEELRRLDGDTWTIAGRCGDRYHAASRWSPDHGPFRDLGLLFRLLAGVDKPAPANE